MPPKETGTPSTGDQKFFAAFFKFLPNSMDIDWNGLALELGLKDARIARTRFSQIRRKYQQKDSVGDSPQQSKVTKAVKVAKGKNAKVTGKGGKKDNAIEDDEEDNKSIEKEELEDDTEVVVKVEGVKPKIKPAQE
ncbi:hypothetical protein Daesc_002945 [Daldinia eschscholtzii]|uniref:Uncharacterized protein n=1 Tax=Daldinia eschscholtzii TaxID=292717 RepID=A0AAX6MT08_9PEZI